MIRREDSVGLVLLSQVDHARLAYDIARPWGNDTVPALPLVEQLLPAIRDHDSGWRMWEKTPDLNEDAQPRCFTEMPMAEATASWSESIRICAGGFPSSAIALERLRSDGGEVTPADAELLDTLLKRRGYVSRERLVADVAEGSEFDGLELVESVRKFIAAGILVPFSTNSRGPIDAINLPSVGPSPAGGMWVSGHFQALAGLARENREDDPDEVAAVDRFLEEQQTLTASWRDQLQGFAGDELSRVVDTGTRYVQFFDRISLWLCMAERTMPWEADLSSDLSFTFTPQRSEDAETPRIITVDPWPFSVSVVEPAVPGLLLAKKTFADSDDLQSALASARRLTLRWTLRPG